MKTIKLNKRNIDLKSLKFKKPSSTDFSHVIREDCIVETEGNLPMLYMKADLDEKKLLDCFRATKCTDSVRTSGLKTLSACLGYKPRVKMKDDFCSMAAMASNSPMEHETFLEYSRQMASIYKKKFPKIYKSHMDSLKRKDKEVLADYIIQKTPFTSGIVNKNNPLKYHKDQGNIRNTLSCMIVLKNDVTGGYLSLPEYDVAFEVASSTIFFFNGQDILHGVTPFRLISSRGYRYSVVFYTLENMWKCLPIDEEIKRFSLQTEKK